MKRIHLFVTLIISSLICWAQDIEVKKFGPLEKDLTAVTSPRKDLNGNTCGLVKVALKEAGAEFEGNVMGDVQFTGSEYLVYLPNGTKRLGIKHPDFLPTTIVFADYGIKRVSSGTTYLLNVKTNKKKAKVNDSKKGMAVFNIIPSNAMLMIDGQIADGSGGAYTLSLPYGTHYYTVKLKDFSLNNQIVHVDKNAKTINVDLTEFFARVDVSCQTEDAEIYTNNELKGTGKWDGMLVPGIYTIDAKKDGCHSLSRQIEIRENDSISIKFPKLKIKTCRLHIDYQPTGCEVWINGEKAGITPYEDNELPIGTYLIEIKKEYYTNVSFKAKMGENQILKESGELKKTEFGELHYGASNGLLESNDEERDMYYYQEMLADYYRLGLYRGYRGNPYCCVRDTFKIPINPLKAVEIIKKIAQSNSIESGTAQELLSHCGGVTDDASIAFTLAEKTMEQWSDLGIPYTSEDYRFVPLAWHYFYGIGCSKNEELARNLMRQACAKYKKEIYDSIDEQQLPSKMRQTKDEYDSFYIEMENAYAIPGWSKLIEDMGLSNELNYVPDYIRKYAPDLFDTIFPDIMNM